MGTRLACWCGFVAVSILIGGCAGKEASPRTVGKGRADLAGERGRPGARASTAPRPARAPGQRVAEAGRGQVSAPGGEPTSTKGASRAPRLKLTPAEAKIGIPFYPGAKPEKQARDNVVLSTADSMEQVEAFYLKQFAGCRVLARGKVGDQAFSHLLLEGGAAEKRAFLSRPSGPAKTKIELTAKKS